MVIDDKTVVDDKGNATKTPYSDEEIARFASLVKETIGFDEARGDSVSVINTSFLEVPLPEIEEVPVWMTLMEEAWVINLVKQVLGGIGVLIIFLMFGRPFLRTLNPNRVDVDGDSDAQSVAMATAGAGQNPQMPMTQAQAMAMQQGGAGIPNLADDPNNPAAMMRRKDATYDQKVDMARTLVVEDPARVANVMKHWVSEE